jgi:hypothetical protein
MFAVIDYTVFFTLVGLTVVAGFLGSKWRAPDFSKIAEWSIGGMRFGSFIVWFLMGADIYTAYSLISIPGAAYSLVASYFTPSFTVQCLTHSST